MPRPTNMFTTGTEFFYMDSNYRKFLLKKADITKPNDNPVYKTLEPLYDEVSIQRQMLMVCIYLSKMNVQCLSIIDKFNYACITSNTFPAY